MPRPYGSCCGTQSKQKRYPCHTITKVENAKAEEDSGSGPGDILSPVPSGRHRPRLSTS